MASDFLLGFDEFFVFYVATEEKDFGGIVHAAVLFLADVDDVLHLREAFALQVATLAGLELGEHGIDHVHEIVATAVAIDDAQGVHVGVMAEVFQFGLLVVGVHGYGYGTNLGTSVEEGEPVGHIACPDAHVGSALYTDGEQALGHVVHTFVELAPSEAKVAVGIHDVFLIGSDLGPVFEPVAEGSC